MQKAKGHLVAKARSDLGVIAFLCPLFRIHQVRPYRMSFRCPCKTYHFRHAKPNGRRRRGETGTTRLATRFALHFN